MADHGVGSFVPDIPIPPPALDYSYNWVNIGYGEVFFVSPTGFVGGTGGGYIDFGGALTQPPVTSPASIWDGTAWVRADQAQVWDGSAWVPFAAAKVWDGSGWV